MHERFFVNWAYTTGSRKDLPHSMKTNLSLAICAVILFAGSVTAQEPGRRTITVQGESDVRVAPDEVRVRLGVESFDLDLETAKAANDDRMEAVLAAAGAAGVADEDLQTDFLIVHPIYDDGHSDDDLEGYRVQKSLMITLHEIDRFEELMTRVLAAGANYVHGIDFRITDLRTHRDHARAVAINAARDKAVAMAGELGQQVGEPVSITEGRGGWWSGYGAWWHGRGRASQNVVMGGTSASPDGPTHPGQISVTARVTVTFELER